MGATLKRREGSGDVVRILLRASGDMVFNVSVPILDGVSRR
jgi:hypothetical protein